MYIDADVIIKAASLLGALGVLISAVVAVYKVVDQNKKQTEVIRSIRDEQTLICYALKACLSGLIEQGCNGPVTAALEKLDKHLNQKAHNSGGLHE